jgi:hypothetical protein
MMLERRARHRWAMMRTEMPFKEKAVVRHKLRPEWGAGRVLLRTGDIVQIDFEIGGLKKLKTAIADEQLEAATLAEATPRRRPKS